MERMEAEEKTQALIAEIGQGCSLADYIMGLEAMIGLVETALEAAGCDLLANEVGEVEL